MTGFFGNFQLDFGGQPSVAAQGDDMAVKSKTITLAEINAAATPSGAIAALTFNVTDVVNATTAGFKTDIDAADDTAAQNAFRLLVDQPWNLFGGIRITVAGTAGYNGAHIISSSTGIFASGGKLAIKTNTALGGTESGLTATAVFTKLNIYAWELPAMPASSLLVGGSGIVRGSAAGGVASAPTTLLTLGPTGAVVNIITTMPNLVTALAGAVSQLGAANRISAVGAALDLSRVFFSISTNQESNKFLDDVTGLDDGVVAAVAYAADSAFGYGA